MEPDEAANERIYCRLCMDTGRVRGLTQDGQTTIDPCVLCHPERLGFPPNEKTTCPSPSTTH